MLSISTSCLKFGLLTVVALLLAGRGHAQSSIVGTVTDPAGGVLPGAVVHAINEATSQTRDAIANAQGYYVFPSLEPSTYTLKVEAGGFSSYTRTGVVLQADQTSTNNVAVSLNAIVQSVEVTSTQPQVDTTTSTLSEVVDQRRVVDDHFINRAYLDSKNYINNTGNSDITFQSATIGESHTFNAATLNEIHLAYGREISVRSPAAGSRSLADLGVKIVTPSADPIIESLSVAGYFSITQTDPATFARNQYTLNDQFSLIRGRHNITLGGEAIDGQVLLRNQFHQPGQFTFTADFNNDALASFLTGNIRNFLQGNGEFKDNRLFTYGLLAEEVFHLSRRVTLTAGLRYDPFFPWHETKGRSEVFDENAYAVNRFSTVYTKAPRGLLFPGDTNVPQYGLAANLKNVAPRVGFAIDLDGVGKTSLRGGLGAFFDSIQNGIYNNRFVDVTPFSITYNVTAPAAPFSDPYRGAINPFPAPQTPSKDLTFPTPVQVVSYDPAHNGIYQTPVLYDANLTLEHQFPQEILARLAYVGTHSSHLQQELFARIHHPRQLHVVALH